MEINLEKIPMRTARQGNFRSIPRKPEEIKYIVIHYTSNKGDTAKNNVDYFATTLTQTSAHYFVSDNDIWQSVHIKYAAYAVGLGHMKKPYIPDPQMYGIITNTNSISIELCGSLDSTEASNETKETAAKLTVALLKHLNLTPSAVYRHYDVTGKPCPKWAVDDPLKWLEFTLMINNLFYKEGDEKTMENTEENYLVFKQFMNRYLEELAKEPATWEEQYMRYMKDEKIITGGRPKSFVTRGELAAALVRSGV